MERQPVDDAHAKLLDEIEQLQTTLEQAHDENTRLTRDRRELLQHIAVRSGGAARRGGSLAGITSGIRQRHDEEMRVAFEELQVMAEELEASNATLRDANRMLDRRVEERTHDLAQAHAEIQAREAELRLISDAVPALIGLVGRDGRFGFANRAWSEWFNCGCLNILGHSVAEVVGAELHAAWADGVRAAFSGFAVGVRCSLSPAGRPARELDTRFIPRRDRSGVVDGIYMLAVDVTEQVRVETVLRDAAATLESKVAERTAELEAEMATRVQVESALRQAQKMEAIGQLTGGVAHDFNNLLTVIRSSTEILRRPGLAEDRRQRYLDIVLDTVDRAARLTGQLLAFARRQTLKPVVFDVGQRLHDVAELINAILGARIAVVVQADCPPISVRADVSQFETALVNMAVNARDAMGGEGELTLALQRDAQPPPGHAVAGGPCVAVSLSDTGIGIEPEILARIYEPFFTTKQPGQGTGLGLSQVFGFAKQSGGTVSVDSKVGHGTTFTLFLPQAEQAPTGQVDKPEAAPDATGGEGIRVLVVDDNVEIGRFARQILQDFGYGADWVPSAAAALDRLPGDFDVVFSDVVMSGMNGLDFAREVRRLHRGLPVVLTSGYSHVLVEEGPQGFDLLHKPYSAEQLSRTLRRAVDAARTGHVVGASTVEAVAQR